jgi:hypothetical protein
MHAPRFRPLLTSSLALLLAACGGSADVSSASIAREGATCSAGQTACNADRTGLLNCERAYGEATATWHSDGHCAITCASSRDSAGLAHDSCVDCEPAAHHCIGAVLYTCSDEGRWAAAGQCPAHTCPRGACE